ncbi:MAG: hypothetical protein V8Q69_11200 [Bacteroides caccae]
MKKGCILCLLISVISLPLIAQNIIYSNLKELLTQHGDTKLCCVLKNVPEIRLY